MMKIFIGKARKRRSYVINVLEGLGYSGYLYNPKYWRTLNVLIRKKYFTDSNVEGDYKIIIPGVLYNKDVIKYYETIRIRLPRGVIETDVRKFIRTVIATYPYWYKSKDLVPFKYFKSNSLTFKDKRIYSPYLRIYGEFPKGFIDILKNIVLRFETKQF